MKKLLLLLIPLLAFSACRKGPDVDPVGPLEGETEVEMMLVASGVATRAAITAEDALNDITILVVDGSGKYQYKKEAWKTSDGTFKSNLKIASGLTLYIAANAKAFLGSSTIENLLVAGTAWADIEPLLVLSGAPSALSYSAGLPMWSRVTNVEIKDQPQNYLGTVGLLRSIASTDITVTKTNFVLEEVYLCYGADRGYLPYDYTKVSGNPIQSDEAISPIGMLTDQQWSTTAITGGATDYSVDNYFYMYENATSLTPSATNRPTKVVLKGKYDNGASTFYPLTFRAPASTPGGTETKLQVTRNCKYIIVVTKVNGDGYGSLDEAKTGEDVNADYSVIEWNMNDDDDIFIDGSKFLSVGGKTATLYRPAGSTCFIPVTTNYTAAEILMKFKGSAVDAVNPLIENDRFKIELKEVNGSLGLLFTAKQAYGDGAADDHTATMVVSVGRIQFEIVINQLDNNPNGWIDGGNQDEDLG